ncbi:MAG: RDD family protein [Mycobacterium sp.]|nr:RDD family protein [Mycobacterium sp.]
MTAGWARRAGALVLDVAPGAAVIATTALVALSVPLHNAWWWTAVSVGAAAILATAFNRILLPSVRGQSLGRAVFGITVVRRDGDPVGPWQLPRRELRRLAVGAVLTAATVCATGAAISYGVVQHHDRSVADAGTQIAASGPRMVEQILGYRTETARQDFDRARSLVTDNYAGQLSSQQQAVQKAGLVRNEYWVTNSSVLTATPERVTMLLFLQGERGTPPNHRYLSASVQATFVDAGRAGWRVDDITVVTAPQRVEAKP